MLHKESKNERNFSRNNPKQATVNNSPPGGSGGDVIFDIIITIFTSYDVIDDVIVIHHTIDQQVPVIEQSVMKTLQGKVTTLHTVAIITIMISDVLILDYTGRYQ